jgi:hypothetical protein
MIDLVQGWSGLPVSLRCYRYSKLPLLLQTAALVVTTGLLHCFTPSVVDIQGLSTISRTSTTLASAGRGRPPEAAVRRAGLEFVEKLLTRSSPVRTRRSGMLACFASPCRIGRAGYRSWLRVALGGGRRAPVQAGPRRHSAGESPGRPRRAVVSRQLPPPPKSPPPKSPPPSPPPASPPPASPPPPPL